MKGRIDTGSKERIVGIAEMIVSDDPDEVLVTYSLGSCLGLVLHDPGAGLGGMLHSMLPLSRMDPVKAAMRPQMFTDTGVAALLQAMFDAGATRSGLVAKVVGASSHVEGEETFKIGERNYFIMRKVLWKNGILLAAEDVGGRQYRTLVLEVGPGRTLVKKNGSTIEL